MPPSEGQFTGTGASNYVGEGPVYYRLNCSTYVGGPIDYFFGYDSLTPPRHLLFMLTGSWTGQVDVQYSTTPKDSSSWANVPDESYTANTARYIRG